MAEKLAALEREVGLLSLGEEEAFDGEIEPDDDETNSGRAVVRYDDEALFAAEGPSDAPTPERGAPPPVALAGDAGGGVDALIAHLEATASELEAAGGQEEVEIRQKIALLRSVLEQRPARQQQAAALAADAAADEGVGVDAATIDALAAELSGVEKSVADDEAVATSLAQSAHLWMPVIQQGRKVGDEDRPASGEGRAEGEPER